MPYSPFNIVIARKHTILDCVPKVERDRRFKSEKELVE